MPRKKKPIEFSMFERQIIFLQLANSHKFKKLTRKVERWFRESVEAHDEANEHLRKLDRIMSKALEEPDADK